MVAAGADTTFHLEVDGLSASLAVARLEGHEGMSELYRFDLVVTSEDKNIQFADVIGKTACLTLKAHHDESRYVHGVVCRFRQAEEGRKSIVYHLTIVPKLWRLQHRHDARIFQEKTVPQIIEDVLDRAGVTDRRLALSGSYGAREYCVQYRESDFAFISRLMEEEGIFYFFEHSEGAHVLVLGDSKNVPVPIAGTHTLPFRAHLGAMAHAGESVSELTCVQEVRPGKVSLTDFNFKKPNLSLHANAQGPHDPDLEIYDYPGEYEMPGEGSSYTKVRLEEWQALALVADGKSSCVRMTPGYTFTLTDHAREDYNATYWLVRIHHRGVQAQLGEEATGEGPSYGNTFQCIPSSVQFRPARVTPRPTVKGVQTAIVTGPAGEEIHTDEHGRIKVHFHWDRVQPRDEKSSCWIRVSQLWAGAGWGAMYIPRIGQEVIVDFIEGDPDRPIVTGRVYHGTNVPPYMLPAEKTKSTIRSNSTIGGGGSNELMFEDNKGNEEIYLHAQKDWTIAVEHDKSQTVGHDETLEVGHDRKKEVKHDQSETIGHDKSIVVKGSHTESILMAESITVGLASAHNVGGAMTENVGAAKTSTVTGTLTEVVGAKMTVTIGGAKEQSIGGGFKEGVTKDMELTVGGKHQISVQKDMLVEVKESQSTEVGKVQSANVGEKYSLVVGDGKLTILKNGDITLEGKSIKIIGSGPIQVKGSKLTVESEGTVDVKASGQVKVKGSSVGIN